MGKVICRNVIWGSFALHLLFNISLYAQTYFASTKEISLRIRLTAKNDSTLLIEGTYVNLSKSALYLPAVCIDTTPYYTKFMYLGNDEELTLSLGHFGPGKYSEQIVKLMLLSPGDSVNFKRFIYDWHKKRSLVSINLDYVGTSSKAEMDEVIIPTINQLYFEKERNYYWIGPGVYGPICKFLYVSLPNIFYKE